MHKREHSTLLVVHVQAHKAAILPKNNSFPVDKHIKCGTYSKCHDALLFAQHGTCCKQHNKKDEGPSNIGNRQKGGLP